MDSNKKDKNSGSALCSNPKQGLTPFKKPVPKVLKKYFIYLCHILNVRHLHILRQSSITRVTPLCSAPLAWFDLRSTLPSTCQ
jgi:hypothetical protein